MLDTQGRLACILHHVEDLTPQYRAKARLRTNDVRYRQVIDSATNFAIVSSDLSGSVTSWNKGAQNILGRTENEMLGGLPRRRHGQAGQALYHRQPAQKVRSMLRTP